MSINFFTCCYGDGLLHYLKVLINSIDETYGDEASIYLYYDEIPLDQIKEIERKVPGIYTRYLKIKKGVFGGRPKNEKEYNARHIRQCAVARQFITAGVNEIEDGLLVVMDCDMLVRKKIVPERYLGEGADWDIVFTYKTEENEMTRWPINAGLQLARNSNRVRHFYDIWDEETYALYDYEKSVFGDWGGMQQTAFGNIIRTRNADDYAKGFVRHGCKLIGVPCKYMNETRRTQNFEDACVLHYKGRWRSVLPNGNFTEYVNPKNAGKMYDLWKGHLERESR